MKNGWHDVSGCSFITEREVQNFDPLAPCQWSSNPDCHTNKLSIINISDGEIYSGAELTSWTFQWDLTLQWWRDLFRCRIDLLNFSMGFNIIAPYMEFLHLNCYIAEWTWIGWCSSTSIYQKLNRALAFFSKVTLAIFYHVFTVNESSDIKKLSPTRKKSSLPAFIFIFSSDKPRKRDFFSTIGI